MFAFFVLTLHVFWGILRPNRKKLYAKDTKYSDYCAC